MSIFRSIDPATGESVWEGEVADAAACTIAVARARAAFPGWAATPVEERVAIAVGTLRGVVHPDRRCVDGEPVSGHSRNGAAMAAK